MHNINSDCPHPLCIRHYCNTSCHRVLNKLYYKTANLHVSCTLLPFCVSEHIKRLRANKSNETKRTATGTKRGEGVAFNLCADHTTTTVVNCNNNSKQECQINNNKTTITTKVVDTHDSSLEIKRKTICNCKNYKQKQQ